MSEEISFEEYLDKNGSLTYSNVGVSMLPLLRQGRDLFTVEKKTDKRCSRGDVVLYKRPPSAYVLHRVIEVRENDYVILGDNCIAKEYGIKDADIIGIMTSFARNGRDHSVHDPGYRFYTSMWLFTMPVRLFLKKLFLKAKSIAKRVLKK